MQQVLAWAHSCYTHGWRTDVIGYIASALVLATFSIKSMCSLRITAIASNLAFISYGATADMRPILILHCMLLPVNVVRLLQIAQGDDWLLGRRRLFPARQQKSTHLNRKFKIMS
jgi:hypothetical protein